MKRVIEISAKSLEEAQELAKKELDPNEKIVGSETLFAPTKGMFGIVGSPDYRMRFTLETVAEAEEPEPVQHHAPVSEPRADHSDGGSFEDEDLEAMDDTDTGDDEEKVLIPAARRQNGLPFSVEFAGEKHPEYAEICGIIQDVARNIGVENVGLVDKIDEETWTIDAAGDNISQLIGKHGRTLDALQYLINIIANKKLEEKKVKIILDVQGYRDQRHKGLIRLANRMYRKALESGRQVELEPMSTVDRRTIHLTLKDKNGIETFSKGVEPLRRVVISPKRPKASGNAPRSGGWRTSRDSRPPRPDQDQQPSRPKSVPMFMEEDGSNEN